LYTSTPFYSEHILIQNSSNLSKKWHHLAIVNKVNFVFNKNNAKESEYKMFSKPISNTANYISKDENGEAVHDLFEY